MYGLSGMIRVERSKLFRSVTYGSQRTKEKQSESQVKYREKSLGFDMWKLLPT